MDAITSRSPRGGRALRRRRERSFGALPRSGEVAPIKTTARKKRRSGSIGFSPLLDATRAPQSLAAISRSNRAALLPSRLPDTFEKANRVPPGSLRKRFIPLRVVRSARAASPRRPFLRVKRADRLIVSLFILTSTRFLLAAGAQARRKTTHLLAKKSQTCCSFHRDLEILTSRRSEARPRQALRFANLNYL
jgi:hypothetical protein